MDFLTLLLTVASVIGGLLGKLIAGEIQDWLPTFGRWLIKQAVKRLPEHERARYTEEFFAHLDECPGKLGKVWHAIQIRRGAWRLSIEISDPLSKAELVKRYRKMGFWLAVISLPLISASHAFDLLALKHHFRDELFNWLSLIFDALTLPLIVALSFIAMKWMDLNRSSDPSIKR